MDSKKKQIMESALKFFSEKGYYSTSVQEIANDCGISKGSLYKYFESKEELFIEVLEYYRNAMFEKAMNVSFEKELNPRERFVQQLIVQIEDFIDKKDFIMIQFKQLPIHQNPKLLPFLRRMKVRMLNWHKKCLLEAYGSEIKEHIWDATIIFQGMLKEYLLLMVNENKYLSIRDTAEHIVRQMDVLVDNMKKKQTVPLLTDAIMSDLAISDFELEKVSKAETLDKIFHEMKKTLEQLSINSNIRQELFATIDLLKDELNTEDPRMFLVHALLSYLEKESELKGYVQHIKKLL
ncbi:MAG TPA: TetR/AcrR family transcriptional regulator [Anoxybacillus sp.]|nr:TetR/AcrR family transcriptional regulator [Anoxybacillus sp.]